VGEPDEDRSGSVTDLGPEEIHGALESWKTDAPDAVCIGGPYDGRIVDRMVGSDLAFFGHYDGPPYNVYYDRTDEWDEQGRRIYRYQPDE